jgi:hypothetical protein
LRFRPGRHVASRRAIGFAHAGFRICRGIIPLGGVWLLEFSTCRLRCRIRAQVFSSTAECPRSARISELRFAKVIPHWVKSKKDDLPEGAPSSAGDFFPALKLTSPKRRITRIGTYLERHVLVHFASRL